jgi:hypothetical protein
MTRWSHVTGFVLGVIFAVASKARVLSLDQPWIFQHIIQLIGLD